MPNALPALTERDVARFHGHVAVGTAEDCWPWTASVFKGGYGQMKVRGRNLKAHRVAYFVATDIDPSDGLICHHCDNPPCCNPAHLYEGTEATNYADAKDRGRLNTAIGERHGSRTQPDSRARGERHAFAKLTEEQVREVRQLYAQGESQRQLSTRCGVSREAISRIVTGQNWRYIVVDGEPVSLSDEARRVNHGEQNGSAKLREQDVRAIRGSHEAGTATVSELAHRYSVSLAAVRFVIQRRTWRHVA